MVHAPKDETGEAEVIPLGKIGAPWGKEIAAEAVRYPSGLQIARLRIREGRRFTVLDVDRPTASWIASVIAQAFDGDEG